MITQITDHAARSIARLAMQYKDKEGHRGTVSAIGAQAQEIEDAIYSLFAATDIDTANDYALDVIGAYFQQARGTFTNTQYRAYLKAMIIALTGVGDRELIIDIVGAFMQGFNTGLTYPPINVISGTAEFTVDFTENEASATNRGTMTRAKALLLAKLLHMAKAGGVRAMLKFRTVSNFSSQLNFKFDTVGAGFDAGQLMGLVDSTRTE